MIYIPHLVLWPGPVLAALAFSVAAPAQAVLRSFPLQNVFDWVAVIGDLDADGVRDVAILRNVSRTIDLYSGRSGAQLHQLVQPAGVVVREMNWLGDVDGDGRDDFVVNELRFNGSTWDSFQVVRSGATAMVIHQLTTPAYLPSAMDDINGDGRAEIAISDFSYSSGTCYELGRMDVVDGATLQVLRSHVGAYCGQGLAGGRVLLGDVDGDGFRDYLTADIGQSAVNRQFRVFSGATGSLLTSLPKLSYTYGDIFSDIGDFNADGFDDVVVADNGNPPYFPTFRKTQVLAGPLLTQILWEHTMPSGPAAPAFTEPAGVVGDLDGDGHTDIQLIGGNQVGDASVVLSGRDQSTLWTQLLTDPQQLAWPGMPSPGDVDGDGFVDLSVRYFGTPRALRFVSGAPPGVTSLGSACTDQTGEQPRIGVGVGARLGKTMTVNLSHANPALLAAVLGLGQSSTSWAGTPLPLDLTVLGLPGCSWYVSGDVALTLPTVGVNGTRHHATYPIVVPQATTLLGLDVFAQWLVLEAGPAGLTGAVTCALRTRVVP